MKPMYYYIAKGLEEAGPADFEERKSIYLPLARGGPVDYDSVSLLADPIPIGSTQPRLFPIFTRGASTPWFVNEAVKTAVERLEPNVHTFLPINVRLQKAKPAPYYLLVIHQAIQAVVIEETQFKNGREKIYTDGISSFEMSPPRSRRIDDRRPAFVAGRHRRCREAYCF